METTQPAVIFVHGNGESAAAWTTVMQRFRTKGLTELFAIDLHPPSHGSVVDAATQLDRYLDQVVLPAVGEHRPLAAVSHSLGGAVLRYALAFGPHAHRFTHAVYIAGAMNGAPACNAMVRFDPGGRLFAQAPQLHTGGAPLVQALADRGVRASVAEMTISSPHDSQFLMFEALPLLDGADNRVLPGLGHWGVRDSEASFELMWAHLTGSECELGRDTTAVRCDPSGYWRSPRLDGGWLRFDAGGRVERPGDAGTFDVRRVSGIGVRANGHEIDLHFGSGAQYGRFRVSISGDQLAVVMGDSRPSHMADAVIMHRAVPTYRPAELCGVWEASQPAQLGTLEPLRVRFAFTIDGRWHLSQVESPDDLVAWGEWAASEVDRDPAAAPRYRLDFWVHGSEGPLLRKGDWWGGLAECAGDVLQVEFPAHSSGAGRPQCLDQPVRLTRA